MGINQTLNYLLNAVVLYCQTTTQKGVNTFHSLIKIANGYDYYAAQNAIIEPVRENKDTTPKSHIVIMQNKFVVHITNLASPSQPCSCLKSQNYQATLTIPINDKNNKLSFLENNQAMVFEFDTTYLTEVLYERDKTFATMSGQNHSLRFEEKSVEMMISSSTLFDDLNMRKQNDLNIGKKNYLNIGKQNDIVSAIECATGLIDKDEISNYFSRLNTFEQQFQHAQFTTLTVDSIRALEILNVSGKNLTMGVLQPNGSVYLQNDKCSFMLKPDIYTHLFNHQDNTLVSPFPFTPDVLKSIFALLSLNISYVNFCVVADKLLIEIAHVRLEFTLPYAVSNFVTECKSDLKSLQTLFNEQFTLIDIKKHILREIKTSQKCPVFLSVNIAAGECTTSVVMPNGSVRTFKVFTAEEQFCGYKIYSADLIKMIEAIIHSAEVKIFSQNYRGFKKVYLEVQNRKHSYANALFELKK